MYRSNKDIAEILHNVALALEVEGEKGFRIKAYEEAAATIEHYSASVYEMWKEDKLEEIPGVGESLAEHLSELFEKGESKHFIDIISEVDPLIFELNKVQGIGPKTAQKLVANLKIDSLDDLLLLAKKGEVAEIEGLGEKSEKQIIESVEQFLEKSPGQDRMLLSVADQIVTDFIAKIPESNSIEKIVAVGSVRRRVPTVGDVDLAVQTQSPSEVICMIFVFTS